MQLILIVKRGTDETTIDLLQKAAKKFKVEVIAHDYRDPLPELDPTEKYLLYRVAPYPGTYDKEKEFYQTYCCVSLIRYAYKYSLQLMSDLGGFAIPKTEKVTVPSDDQLAETAERVGGYPLIVKHKIPGGHGIGVIQVDSLEGLLSVARTVFAHGDTSSFQMQEFLAHDRHARLIVLGGEVIDSIAYNKTNDDFRTNRAEKDIDVEPVKFSKEVEQAAIRATEGHLFDFGGVDVIEGDDENYVLEVNNPAYFPRAQLSTKFPTSEKMVEYLIAKASQEPRAEWPGEGPRPVVVLINDAEDKLLKAAFQRQARYLDLWVLEVAPDATEFPDLRADTSYLLYRTSVTGRQTEIEIHEQFKCTSFAGSYPVLTDPAYDRNALYRKHDVPFVPKATLREKSIPYLKDQQADVGAFPLMLRSAGGGATSFAQVDTFEGLISLTDYVLALKRTATLQPILNIAHFVRLVVLEGEVITAIEYLSKGEGCYCFSDFDIVLPWSAPNDIKDLACKAARLHELDCTAVNIVIDADGKAMVEDLTYPFNFYREEHVTGVNVAERMLNRLLARCAEINA
ncbi:MAG: hypothetical protein HN673_04895 [Rhodospirillales bacterium]|nr:hypothetical protein [Rhodospirillales bacterium]